MELNNIILVLVGLAILWFIWKSRLRSRTPEAQYEVAELDAAREDAQAALPAGWDLMKPDRERFGSGTDGVVVFGSAACDADGRGILGLGLSQPESLRALAAAARGDAPLADAWAPPVSDLVAATADAPANSDAALPMGWTLVAVDRESFWTRHEPVSAFGALAVGPGGQRALAVALDRAVALERLVDRIEGRLPVTDTAGFALEAKKTGI